MSIAKYFPAWRIVPRRRADDAFTGEGSFIYGGRWNSIGRHVVYASESRALAALEILVHAPPALQIEYVLFRAEIPLNLVETYTTKNLPVDWRSEPPCESTKKIGDLWIEQRGSLALMVPSVLIPAEINALLNPFHPDFRKVKIVEEGAYAPDPRLTQ